MTTIALVVATPGSAQTFTNLHSFFGASPARLQTAMVLSGTTLYGTTSQGGTNGCGAIFSIQTNGTGKATVWNFTGAEGIIPNDLILSGSTLYGTAQAGGANNTGTVFKVNTNGTGFTTLHTFNAFTPTTNDNSDGGKPEGHLVLSGSTLYGTTVLGGADGWGTVFSISTSGSGFTLLHTFTSGTDGANPIAGLTLSGTTLYGTAAFGGDPDAFAGTVFKVGTNGAGFTVLYTFLAGNDGADPFGALTLSGTTLYGTASSAGSGQFGTVFSLGTNGTGFTTLYSFTDGDDGAQPQAALILSGTTLYSTAGGGGGSGGSGTVFKLHTNGTGFGEVYSFTAATQVNAVLLTSTNSDGANSFGGLVLSGSTLFGTTANAGVSSGGTVYSVLTSGTDYTVLHSFIALGDGANPMAGVTLSGTTLYAAAYHGGAEGFGLIFKMNDDGTGVTTLYNFPNLTGSNLYGTGAGGFPTSPLLLSGTTLYGTASGYNVTSTGITTYYTYGSVFKVNVDGTGFTNLHSFTGNSGGCSPTEGLILVSGTLYGTTSGAAFAGSSAPFSTVYAVNTSGGGFTTLHTFSGTEGDYPIPQGTLSVSGSTLYGIFSYGLDDNGFNNPGGAVYSIKTNGAGFSTLYTSGTNFPTSLVLSGTALYGTMETPNVEQGIDGGTVFSLNTSGSGFTTLHTFTTDGGSSVVLSGTTLYGTSIGNADDGAVFSIGTNGTGYSVIHTLDGYTDGAVPAAVTVSGTTLYGTGAFGGTLNLGTAYSLTVP